MENISVFYDDDIIYIKIITNFIKIPRAGNIDIDIDPNKLLMTIMKQLFSIPKKLQTVSMEKNCFASYLKNFRLSQLKCRL